MKIGCILLAAGAGSRFGGSKLNALLKDKPIIEYILESLPNEPFHKRIIVAANTELLHTAQRYGFEGVINDRPELGASLSIRMGLEALGSADACMFCVADQPLLQRDTLLHMLKHYEPGTILTLESGGVTGNPNIFPSELFIELAGLTGDEAGKTVISRHTDMLRRHSVFDTSQLRDIDTQEHFREVNALLEAEPQRLH